MKWSEVYKKTTPPGLTQISSYIDSDLWEELCAFVEGTYGVSPSVEHSICSGAPGWNVKYKKSSRPICTLYPEKGYYTAMISVGRNEATEAELMLPGCTDYLQELYGRTTPFNGGRWLMIEVRSPEILEDVKRLIELRMRKK